MSLIGPSQFHVHRWYRAERCITGTDGISRFWEPEINDSLFDMGSLVKADAMFVLENIQVNKIDNWTLLGFS